MFELREDEKFPVFYEIVYLDDIFDATSLKQNCRPFRNETEENFSNILHDSKVSMIVNATFPNSSSK